MSTEFGIFDGEGCVESGFFSRTEAERIARENYAEDTVHVAECCEDHPDQERETCEHCNAEDDG